MIPVSVLIASIFICFPSALKYLKLVLSLLNSLCLNVLNMQVINNRFHPRLFLATKTQIKHHSKLKLIAWIYYTVATDTGWNLPGRTDCRNFVHF